MLGESRPEPLHTLLLLGFRELVGLGKDDGERNAVFAQHLDKAQVDLLGFEADVRQHEQEVHLLAFEYVVGDELRKLSALRLRRAGIAVAGQVDEIPRVVDAEMVHQPGFAGCSRHFGQASAGGEHVDERRLADVAAPDEGDVFQVVFRDLRNALRRAFEFGFGNLHRFWIFYLPPVRSIFSELRITAGGGPLPRSVGDVGYFLYIVLSKRQISALFCTRFAAKHPD